MKKYILFCCFQAVLFFGHAQQARIETAVYSIPSTTSEKVFPLFNGAGAVLSKQSLSLNFLKSKKKYRYTTTVDGDELFFIIKEGPVVLLLNKKEYTLDKGSVVFVLPGDEVSFISNNKDDAAIYEMHLNAEGRNLQRGQQAGPSFAMNWNDMVFKPHDKGGVRQLFDRKTVTMNRFDIHITTLNPGLKSHDPHTHVNEEIILMIDGVGEMQLGNKKSTITNGGAAWVESLIPHNITNIANRPATYFAIQWN